MTWRPVVTITSTELPAFTCPYCGAVLGGSTGIDHRPSPGAYSICAECFNVGIFEVNLQVGKISEKELQALKESPEWKRLYGPMTDHLMKLKAAKRKQ